MSDARDRMIDSAVVLLAQKGLQATSFSSVLAASQAPRGSIYHHFPQGKDQLVAAAIDVAGERAVHVLGPLEGRAPADVVDGFLALWRGVLTQSALTAGCSVLAVTVASESPDLLARARQIFRTWRERLAAVLVSGGVTSDDADDFAALVISAAEGAVVLSRAEQDLAPFEAVARQLHAQAERL